MLRHAGKQEELLALWTSDPVSDHSIDWKEESQDQGDDLVKSLLSFDSDSDGESHCEQTCLSFELSNRMNNHQEVHIFQQGRSRDDTSSMASATSVFTCAQQLVTHTSGSLQDTSGTDPMGTGSPNESSSQPESALANTHRHKRQKVQWTLELQACFSEAVQRLGAEQAVPSNILEALGKAGVGLTLQDVATRLLLYHQAQPTASQGQPSPPVARPMGPAAALHMGMPWGMAAGGLLPSGVSMLPDGMPRPLNMVHGSFPGSFSGAPAGMPMVGNFPMVPYALPMQMQSGQCWVSPPYSLPAVAGCLPQPPMQAPLKAAPQQLPQQPLQQQWLRPMPMIPTPNLATQPSLHGSPPEAINQAIADVLLCPSQALPPIGLKLDAVALAKQWNSGQVTAVKI